MMASHTLPVFFTLSHAEGVSRRAPAQRIATGLSTRRVAAAQGEEEIKEQ